MQRITTLCFCMILFFSCKKEEALNRAYAGTWELEKSMSMVGIINHAPGNGQIISLGSTGNYERRIADTVLYRGSFSIESKKDCDGDVEHAMFKTSESGTDFRIAIENERLVLSTSACYADGGTAWYRRLN